MDQLGMDALRCMQDGYGFHYGHWKADHQNTQAENEPLIKKHEEEQRLTAEERRIQRRMKVCPVCGELFLPSKALRVCCSKECRAKYNSKMIHRVYENTVRTAICLNCGKAFQYSGVGARKYCSPECRNDMANKRDREARAKLRKMEGKTKWQHATRYVYDVWDIRKDEQICKNLTAQECAEKMGLTITGFRSAAGHAVSRKYRAPTKWRIERRDIRTVK